MKNFDHILVIGFGAPEKTGEIEPYLKEVTRGVPIPEARLKEVVHHYEMIGGFSPYNRYTRDLCSGISENLSRKGISLPLFLGMRNWNPFLTDTLAQIKAKGFQKGLGIILAAHRSDASYEKYLRSLVEAREKAHAFDTDYDFLGPWHDHPRLIKAQAAQVEKKIQGMSPELRRKVPVLFSAHSIPQAMAEKSNYAGEIRATSEAVAKELDLQNWQIVYQSRSGNPREPWLEPDVLGVIQKLHAQGEKTAVVVPVGFLCDNAEVLYDLDIEAKGEAEKLGLHYLRASTVMDHPEFVEMFAELIQAQLTPLLH